MSDCVDKRAFAVGTHSMENVHFLSGCVGCECISKDCPNIANEVIVALKGSVHEGVERWASCAWIEVNIALSGNIILWIEVKKLTSTKIQNAILYSY